MFKPCKNEKLNKYTATQLAIYQRFLDMKEEFYKVIKAYDGKMVTKRFLSALVKASPTHTKKRYDGVDIEMKDFDFNFNAYCGELTISFRGIVNGVSLYYSNEFCTQFTIYDYDNSKAASIYNKRLNYAKYLPLVDTFFSNIEKRVDDLIDQVEHYDKVSKVYEKAYELLKEVKGYHYLCHYADLKVDPHMYYLKGTYIY
jgi:hypothetical protein